MFPEICDLLYVKIFLQFSKHFHLLFDIDQFVLEVLNWKDGTFWTVS